MKKVLASILCGMILTLSVPQKSHAIVGLIIKKKTVAAIGGATTGAGVISLGIAKIVATTSPGFLVGLGWDVTGLGLGALGIVVLDDDEAVFDYPVMNLEKAEQLGVTAQEMEVYNRELNKLNRVKEMIEDEMTNDTTIEEARSIWQNACSGFLSLETCDVKAKVADEIIGNLKVIK